MRNKDNAATRSAPDKADDRTAKTLTGAPQAWRGPDDPGRPAKPLPNRISETRP